MTSYVGYSTTEATDHSDAAGQQRRQQTAFACVIDRTLPTPCAEPSLTLVIVTFGRLVDAAEDPNIVRQDAPAQILDVSFT